MHFNFFFCSSSSKNLFKIKSFFKFILDLPLNVSATERKRNIREEMKLKDYYNPETHANTCILPPELRNVTHTSIKVDILTISSK